MGGRQTPKHVVMFCPNLAGRDHMLDAAGTTDYSTLLNTRKGLHAVTSWLLQRGALSQFSAAKEMAEEDQSAWRPLPALEAARRKKEEQRKMRTPSHS